MHGRRLFCLEKNGQARVYCLEGVLRRLRLLRLRRIVDDECETLRARRDLENHTALSETPGITSA